MVGLYYSMATSALWLSDLRHVLSSTFAETYVVAAAAFMTKFSME